MRITVLALIVWGFCASASSQTLEFRVDGTELLAWDQDGRAPDICRVRLASRSLGVLVSPACTGSPQVCSAPLAPIDVAVLPPAGDEARLECAYRLTSGAETVPGVSVPFVLFPPTPPAAATGLRITRPAQP